MSLAAFIAKKLTEDGFMVGTSDIQDYISEYNSQQTDCEASGSSGPRKRLTRPPAGAVTDVSPDSSPVPTKKFSPPRMKRSGITFVPYSMGDNDERYAIDGNTYSIKDQLKSLGARFDANIPGVGKAWWFSADQLKKYKKYFASSGLEYTIEQTQ